MTATFATQIELDDRGIAWIVGTKVKLIEVVLDKIAYGSSPEEIHFQRPNRSLAQIYGALTYYYETRARSMSRSGTDWKSPISWPPIFPLWSSGASWAI